MCVCVGVCGCAVCGCVVCVVWVAHISIVKTKKLRFFRIFQLCNERQLEHNFD